MPWSDQRTLLLGKIEELSLQLRPPKLKELSIPERRSLRAEREQLLLEYGENLPRLAASRCPICQEIFELPFDNGLDGPWWRHVSPVPMPPPNSCEHYRLFLGAIDLHGRIPSEAKTGVIAGPGAPFVIERLLNLEGMQVVLSTLPLAHGDTGYLCTYFSAAPTDPTELHQCWRKETWVLYDPEGNPTASKSVNDPWQFDLQPSLDAGVLHWIAPGDSSLALQNGSPHPYQDLPGTRQAQLIQSGQVRLSNPPDGSPSGLFERA